VALGRAGSRRIAAGMALGRAGLEFESGSSAGEDEGPDRRARLSVREREGKRGRVAVWAGGSRSAAHAREKGRKRRPLGPGRAGKRRGRRGEGGETVGRAARGEKRRGKRKEKWASPNSNRRGKIKVLQMLLNLILKFEFK
jgi:hypothetical protein